MFPVIHVVHKVHFSVTSTIHAL